MVNLISKKWSSIFLLSQLIPLTLGLNQRIFGVVYSRIGEIIPLILIALNMIVAYYYMRQIFKVDQTQSMELIKIINKKELEK